MDAVTVVRDLVAVFSAGVVVSFTPCVYPVMPLTASCIARANITGSKTRAFFLSLVYVLGLAVAYSILAIFAALTGRFFGLHYGNPIIYSVIAIVLCVFGLIMLDVIRLPQIRFIPVGAGIQPKGWGTVFLFGVSSALVVGPCTAPALGGILSVIAAKQNIFYGIGLMLSFSYGLGCSLILIGTFSGIVGAMPKSGRWMVWVKKGCGVVLLLVAAWFVSKIFFA